MGSQGKVGREKGKEMSGRKKVKEHKVKEKGKGTNGKKDIEEGKQERKSLKRKR